MDEHCRYGIRVRTVDGLIYRGQDNVGMHCSTQDQLSIAFTFSVQVIRGDWDKDEQGYF